MKPRAAALAIAAPLLFAAPALAEHGKRGPALAGGVTIETGNGTVSLGIDNRGYSTIGYHNDRRGYGDYRYGDRRYGDRQARRRAIRACRRAIRDEAHYIGFRDVDFDDGRYAERIGPRGYRVTFNEVEFEGRRREFERPVTCIVRGGDRVVDIYGIPTPGHRGYGNRGYDNRGHRGHRGHRGNGYYK